MRFLSAALAGLAAGLMLAFAATSVEFIIAQRHMPEAMHCGDFMCDGAVQIGGVRVIGIAFLIGFAVASWPFLRGRRRTGV
jgi:hypothetical protein